jgi:hypothetical protein
MTKENGQGDCFVPRNDGKSLVVHHSLNKGTTSPWFVQKPDDTPFPETKELKLIRHCEKTRKKKFFILQNARRGFRGNLLKLVPSMTKDGGQGDCFVPRNDGKGRHNPRHRMKEGALIRHCEKTRGKKFFILQNA